MIRYLDTTGRYAVDIMQTGDGVYRTYASHGVHTGEGEFWFTVGHYATLRNAQRAAIKRMAKQGLELIIPA